MRVGIGVFIIKDGKILLGKRKGSHAAGTWHLPGGKLDWFESWEECAQREALEETGILIKNITYLTTTNDIFVEDREHFVTIFMRADWYKGEATVLEPNKCEEWQWFELNQLPKSLMLPLRNLFCDRKLKII